MLDKKASSWTRRAACLLVIVASTAGIFVAQAQSVSGRWDLTVETPQGKATPSIDLRQNGEELTGTYKGRLGEAPLEGTLRGDDIAFSVTLKFRDQEITVRYTGKVQDDSMKGTVQFGGSASGSWSARRQS
jgi:hypothetical protein